VLTAVILAVRLLARKFIDGSDVYDRYIALISAACIAAWLFYCVHFIKARYPKVMRLMDCKAVVFTHLFAIEVLVRVVIFDFASELGLKLFGIEMSDGCGTANALFQIGEVLFNVVSERVNRSNTRNNYSSLCHKFIDLVLLAKK
jgi:hypothetical protein